MKETTVLNRISNLVDNINYKSLYIEIDTGENKYTLEREKHIPIGFDNKVNSGTKHLKVGR